VLNVITETMVLLEIFFLLFGDIVAVYVTTISGTWSTWRQSFDDDG
jgi:hypothetical protein